MGHRLRIAWFSPLNCGVAGSSTCAYVSDQLLPELSADFEIDLFHDSFERYQNFRTFHYLSAFCHDQDNPYDLFFYQVEDRKAADFCRMHLGLAPGIVLFHDFIMRTRGPVSLLESPWLRTISRVNSCSAEDFASVEPLAWREAACAPFAVFSDPRSLDEFRRKVTLRIESGRSLEESSFYLPLPAACGHASAAQKVFTVCSAAGVQVEHRAHKMLLALSRCKVPVSLIWLVDSAEEGLARELLAEYGIRDARIISGRSPARWAEVAGGADAAVHTLFSAYGQCGPWLQISLMAGLPCLITDFGSADYWPEGLLFKIEPGESEAVQIAAVLEKLAATDLTAQREASRSYASCEFATPKVASELARIFELAAPVMRDVRRRWSMLADSGKRELVVRSLGEDPLCRQALEPVYRELGWSGSSQQEVG